jgi:hypothetical protein
MYPGRNVTKRAFEMKTAAAVIGFFLLGMCAVSTVCAKEKNHRRMVAPILQDAFCIGFNLSCNNREGYLHFGDKYGDQSVPRDALWLWGISGDKRFPLTEWLRGQIGVNASFGSSNEDTSETVSIVDSTIQHMITQNTYVHIAVIPELQLPISVSPDASLFLTLGGGLHFLDIKEQEFLMGFPDIRITDPDLQDHSIFTISIHGGAGFEFVVNHRIGFVFSYSYRYWVPVNYDIASDLYPLKPINYRERYLTHTFELVISQQKK